MRRKLMILFSLIFFLAIPVNSMEISAPTVPESGAQLMPKEPESFGEGLLWVANNAMKRFQPEFIEAAKMCIQVLCAVLLTSVAAQFPVKNQGILRLVNTLSIGIILFGPANSLIALGSNTVRDLSEYGKLLLPVMTTAMAAQGGITTASALYTGTAFFNAFLTAIISSVIVPLLYVYLCLCIMGNLLEGGSLAQLKGFVKWVMTWLLKIVLYVFTGYLSITGVVSGTADASAVKAAKLTISGVVPVVGGILSDASEAVLVSTGILKNAAGIYGVLALLSVWIGPFLKIGIRYLLLKFTASVCDIFGEKKNVSLVHDFSGGMGMLVGMTGTVCLLHLISTVCFMKGIG